MTVKGAPPNEIARAVRHSMVVIDADKHELNYKLSAQLEGITSLKAKYQDGGGASTIISRAGSETRIPKQRPRVDIDPKTGEKIHYETGETYTKLHTNKRTGIVTEKVITRIEKSNRMRDTKDAMTLSSGMPIETVYATYANQMKALANQARLEMIGVKSRPYSPSAREVYQKEVDTLVAQLNIAKKAAPMERKAQLLTDSIVKKKQQDNPGMSKETLKKVRNQALAEARLRVGSKKKDIKITPREWDAIQAGAISPSMLNDILKNTKSEMIKQLATPRTQTGIPNYKLNRAKAMLNSGHTQAEVAAALGISTSTLIEYLP